MKYKNIIFLTLLFLSVLGYSQSDDSSIYKKRVLENPEVDILTSYYAQDGQHASVTGGIGTEKLSDIATHLTISVPLNADDILTIDGTVSSYTSASSSNLDPFPGGENSTPGNNITGSPWVASSGASLQDVWTNGHIQYSHSTDSRNRIWSANLSTATEQDYFSFGFGGSYSMLFNEKNTELDLKTNIYLDTWIPYYPIEIRSYLQNPNMNYGYFGAVPIWDSNQKVTSKNSAHSWRPVNTTMIENTARNTFSGSLSFSQILSQRAQFSFFADVVVQKGWLSNPLQRVYFADIENYYIGNANNIPNYTTPQNTDVFQLADDIERLPHSRLKIPLGVRLNYFLNEFLVVRTYYRYYFDDWGMKSNTASIELPIKITPSFTIYPSFRYYQQSESTYFAPYEKHLSTEKYYTSDYDLSTFNTNQFGFGIKYSDTFSRAYIDKIRMKSLTLNYAYYTRNIGFTAGIVTLGAQFAFEYF